MHDTPRSKAARFYLRILVVLLALAGLLSLAGLQGGWLVTAGKIQPSGSTMQAENDAGDVFTANGPVIALSQVIPVDPRLTYDISAEVRALDTQGDQFDQTRIYLGAETFDENMKPLRSGPGTFRYGGALNYFLAPAQGWTTLEGTMHGEGDELHDQFRPGTRFIQVVALLNHQSEGRTVEIRNVRFSPKIEWSELP